MHWVDKKMVIKFNGAFVAFWFCHLFCDVVIVSACKCAVMSAMCVDYCNLGL